MKKVKIYQVDAFTRQRFQGNPAGVVPFADGLTDEQMLHIARELNNSETAFVFPSHDPAYDVHVRFFTPVKEVPICGHATISTHYVRAKLGQIGIGRTVQKTGAGILPVDILKRDGDYSVVMTQGSPSVGEPLPEKTTARILAALGLTEKDLVPGCPVAVASTGSPKIMVCVDSAAKIQALVPDLTALAPISGETDSSGFYIFTLNPEKDPLAVGRYFSPTNGIAEDPVTGNANGPLGAYLVHYGICQGHAPADRFEFNIRQGKDTFRTGGMHVHVDKKAGEPVRVQITGDAVIAFETEVEFPE